MLSSFVRTLLLYLLSYLLLYVQITTLIICQYLTALLTVALTVYLLLYVQITIFPDDTVGIASESNTWTSFIQRMVAPEIYGFEKLDSLRYYTNRLVELNKKVRA